MVCACRVSAQQRERGCALLRKRQGQTVMGIGAHVRPEDRVVVDVDEDAGNRAASETTDGLNPMSAVNHLAGDGADGHRRKFVDDLSERDGVNHNGGERPRSCALDRAGSPARSDEAGCGAGTATPAPDVPAAAPRGCGAQMMTIGELVVAPNSSKVYVGVVDSEPYWGTAAGGRRDLRRRSVEWANAEQPLQRDKVSETAYSRMRTLLTDTEITDPLAEFDGRGRSRRRRWWKARWSARGWLCGGCSLPSERGQPLEDLLILGRRRPRGAC